MLTQTFLVLTALVFGVSSFFIVLMYYSFSFLFLLHRCRAFSLF